MAHLLACEAVTRAGSVWAGDVEGGWSWHRSGGSGAAAHLPGWLDESLRAHGRPRAVAVATGPGSFTGLRIAAVAVRTLAWVEDLPVICVDTLAAIAAQAGDGWWWVLQPLKRDTTFHGLYCVAGGRVETVVAPEACADAEPPPADPHRAGAVAIGPALAEKPDLLWRWEADPPTGSPAAVEARGVALAATSYPQRPWAEVLPDYRLASAPELQRAKGVS